MATPKEIVKRLRDVNESERQFLIRRLEEMKILEIKEAEASGKTRKQQDQYIAQRIVGGGFGVTVVDEILSSGKDTTLAEVSGNASHTKIVLLGYTGAGKSALANTLLGQKAFKSKVSLRSVTTDIQHASADTKQAGRITVIDTPGFFDTDLSPEDFAKHMQKFLPIAAPSIKAFLIVLPASRWSAETNATIIQIKKMLNKEVFENAIIVFTKIDQIDESIDAFVRQGPEEFKQLLRQCGGRYIGVDNKADQEKKTEMQQQLLQEIQRLPGVYTDDLLKKAHALIQKMIKENANITWEELLHADELLYQFKRILRIPGFFKRFSGRF